MPRKRTKAAKQAQALLVWLESLELPTRVINALRRDLEVITGEREGEEGSGVLAGFDQARFTEELYQKRGGQVGKVPTVAKGAIDALRAAIPAPVSGDGIEAAQEAQSPEATQPAQAGQEPAKAAQEGIEEAQGDEPALESTAQEALPELADAAPADASGEQPAGAAPVATPDAPAAPKRRGRPPQAAVAVAAPAEPAAAPDAPAKRRGRSPRDEAVAGLPARTRRARVAAALAVQQAAPLVEAPAPAPAMPAVPPAADPSFAVLLRLWRELHPQGQRAAMHYMASLTGEA